MSFLDRIRNNDKQEVELNPSEAVSTETHSGPDQRQDGDDDEVELSDDSTGSSDSGGSFLPGTDPEISSDQSTTSAGPSSTTSPSGPDEEKLDEIMEQNERIIELLKQIAGANSASRSSSSDSSTSNKELW